MIFFFLLVLGEYGLKAWSKHELLSREVDECLTAGESRGEMRGDYRTFNKGACIVFSHFLFADMVYTLCLIRQIHSTLYIRQYVTYIHKNIKTICYNQHSTLCSSIVRYI